MDRQEAFNHLFENGFDYEFYTNRSERHAEKMKKSYDATSTYLQELGEEVTLVNEPLKVLCIAENWCGDCGNGVPVIARIAKEMDQWKFRITSRDDHEEVVEQHYTTAGRKKIPVIIFADEDGDEITRWVERPTESYKQLAELQSKKLPKEEYIKEYKSNPTLKPPQVSQNITDELLQLATKAATMNKILPKKR